ncbi:hypothetical protein PENANT_c018G05561 [Penicillium antarcticum]|uniref:Uncharacterized protein n=1 Tax=Penicillium antarcticum TaxID=416450 RepID=A0A1V6Q168_9EURO|nr:hypothetical protein PENANT_c018G05561 [Penicillium antarcticum]
MEAGNYVMGPNNRLFVNVKGDQPQLRFQIPYGSKYRGCAGMGFNFDFVLPVAKQYRGAVSIVNYTSPGSIHPAPDIHEFTIYLPKDYERSHGKAYPILRLSHRGDGNGQNCRIKS